MLVTEETVTATMAQHQLQRPQPPQPLACHQRPELPSILFPKFLLWPVSLFILAPKQRVFPANRLRAENFYGASVTAEAGNPRIITNLPIPISIPVNMW